MNNNTKQTLATFDAVAAACEAIESAGGRASVRAVIAHLGGGSPNAVVKHLRDWRDQKPLIEARRAIVIDERIATLIAEQIERASSEARTSADEERAAAVADYELLANTGRELEAQAEVDAARIEELEQRTQHDAGVIDSLRADAEKTRADAAAAIAAAKAEAAEVAAKAQGEAAAERAKNDDLGRQLGAVTTRADSLEAKVADLAQQVADLTAKLDVEHAGRTAAEKALAVSETNNKALEERITVTYRSVEETTRRASDAEGALFAERVARSAAETAAAKAQAQADERAKLIDALNASLAAQAKATK